MIGHDTAFVCLCAAVGLLCGQALVATLRARIQQKELKRHAASIAWLEDQCGRLRRDVDKR